MQDADSGKSFVEHWIAGGVRENRVLSAVYTLTVDGQLRGIVATHVDDLLYAFDGPVGQGVIDHIKQHLILSKQSECNFSFCGREVRQDAEIGDNSVRVTCEATTLKINEIRFEGNHVHVRKTAQEAFDRVRAGAVRERGRITTMGDPHCARRVSGGRVSKLQQMKKQAAVAAAVFANKVLQYLKKTATRGLVFRMGVYQLASGRLCDRQRL